MPQAMMNVPMRSPKRDPSRSLAEKRLPAASISAESILGHSQGEPDPFADAISALKATCANVEQLLVSNELLLAESTAAAAIETYTKTLGEFSADATVYPTAKLSAVLLPFWRLVTLLVQVRLSMPQPATPSGTAESPRTPQQTPREDLPNYLPRLFDRLEAARRGSVPPASRLLHAQVLRALGMSSAGAQYLETQVLPLALASDCSAQDGDDQGFAKSNGSTGHRDAILAPSQHLNHYNGNGADTTKPRKIYGNGNSDSNGAAHVANGDAASTKSSRAARLFRWTPSLLLSAVELFVDLRFEAAANNAAQTSPSPAPRAGETLIKRLQDAEGRCIDFVTANSLALSNRLRSCISSEAGHSVADELLLRIQSSHTKELQVWNREQQQHLMSGQKPGSAQRPPETASQPAPATSLVATPKSMEPEPRTNGTTADAASKVVERPSYLGQLQRLLDGVLTWWKTQSSSHRLLGAVLPLLLLLLAMLTNRLRMRWRSGVLSAPPQRRQLTF